MMNFNFLAAVNAAELMGDAGMTILIGLVVVFSVLLLLTLVFKVFGMVATAGSKENSQKQEAKPAKSEASGSVPAVAATKPAPVVQNGISDEVVAVIAAAIAAMSEDGKQYTVRRIVRAQNGTRPVWAAAGIAENTRSF